MSVSLPAATDIYLIGGKLHGSEIRLARYLILNLESGDQFLDIGAHFGYFTLLASEIVGKDGLVYAFEASARNLETLKTNSQNHPNVKTFGKAVSDDQGGVDFYEFPNLYSEYNSVNVRQFEAQEWFSSYQPDKREVSSTTIDIVTLEDTILPRIIKVDVEGAEYKVMKGAINFFDKSIPYGDYGIHRTQSAQRSASKCDQTIKGFGIQILHHPGKWRTEADGGHRRLLNI